jgi:predicted AAA+ superfamily ATPase
LELVKLGGFPEPYFSSSDIDAKRWSREYRTRLVREDLATLEQVIDLDSIERLMLRLPALVGSPLSINGLTHDLEVSHKTLTKWLVILERLYAIFRLAPFGTPRIKAVKKEQKHFHYDWTLVKDNGPRFENMVALHLLKWVHFQQDTKAREVDLRYFRNVDLREVDFVVTEDEKPILLVECKWSDDAVTRGLHYLKERFPEAEAWQIAATGKKDYQTPNGIRVCPALTFLKDLV